MDDLAMPQNQEEYMWLHPSQCQSPSLLSESEDEDEVSVIPSTPERSPKEKRGSYSGSSVRTEFDKAHR